MGFIRHIPIRVANDLQDHEGHAVYSLENAIDDLRELGTQRLASEWERIEDAYALFTKFISAGRLGR